ncbi:hypothetical protein SLS62_008490 [Diatrype stigma]|uniref:Uncharacterized protein n=1 Tax=Diatrype stigma TaxID=117547 RepID=A0AAN9UMH6_9PEZI
MSTLSIRPTPATTFEPIQVRSADEHRRQVLIRYAWDIYGYIITSQEADEILNEGLWDDVDQFIRYMWDANFGEATPDSTNVKLPGAVQVYGLEQLGLARAVSEPSGDSDGDDTDEGDDEDGISLASTSSLTLTGYEMFEDAELGWLPVYTADSPPSYASCAPLDPPEYTLAVAVEATGEGEDATSTVEITPVLEPTSPDKEEGAIPGGEKIPCASDEKSTGVFASMGARMDRKILKAKRGVARRLKAISPRRAFRRACRLH